MGRLPNHDLPFLILLVLSEKPSHGYAIAREIEQRSGQSLKLREGSLYPALKALERGALIEGQWEMPTNPGQSGPARKVYTITDAGRADLAKRTLEWERRVAAVQGVMGRQNDASTTG